MLLYKPVCYTLAITRRPPPYTLYSLNSQTCVFTHLHRAITDELGRPSTITVHVMILTVVRR